MLLLVERNIMKTENKLSLMTQAWHFVKFTEGVLENGTL